MKTAEKKAGSSRSKSAKARKSAKRRVSGQPAIDPKYRYMELIVDNDKNVANAINKIVKHAGTSKKEAIQSLLLDRASKL